MSRLLSSLLDGVSLGRGLRSCLFLWLSIALAACVSLPSREGISHSVAAVDTQRTLLGMVVSGSLPAGANGFRLLKEPEVALEARLALIVKAERTIDLQSFSWSADASGARLLFALREAAGRGVRIRLLLDDLHAGEIEPWFEQLQGAGQVEVRLFNPVAAARGSAVSKILVSLGNLQLVRHRMHNKLFITDNQIAIVGGRNVGDDYFVGGGPRAFLDLDMLVAGPLVREMSESFDDYWNSDHAFPLSSLRPARGEKPAVDDIAAWSALHASTAEPALKIHDELNAGILLLETCASARMFADPVEKVVGMSLEDSGGTLHQRLIDLFAASSSEIYIVSPYFVRGTTGLKRIRDQVARGIRLRLLTNSLLTTDVPIAHVAYLRYRKQLLQLGAEIREFAPRAAVAAKHIAEASRVQSAHLHAKVAIVDQRWLYVGSLNFTSRSERLNTELGLILDCPAMALQALHLVEQLPAFDLRLNRTLLGIEWVDKRSGVDQVWHAEPEVTLWRGLTAVLLALLVPEEEI